MPRGSHDALARLEVSVSALELMATGGVPTPPPSPPTGRSVSPPPPVGLPHTPSVGAVLAGQQAMMRARGESWTGRTPPKELTRQLSQIRAQAEADYDAAKL